MYEQETGLLQGIIQESTLEKKTVFITYFIKRYYLFINVECNLAESYPLDGNIHLHLYLCENRFFFSSKKPPKKTQTKK